MRPLRSQSVSQRSGSPTAGLTTADSPLGGAAVDVDQRAGDAGADVAGEQGGHGGYLLDRVQPFDGGLGRVVVEELLIGDARTRGRLRSEFPHRVRLDGSRADRVAGNAHG